MTVESGVILTLDDVTVAGTAIANHGTVKVDASSKLTLNGASLTGGALTVSGTLNSTGTTTITDANISNNYLIEATLGALTLLATTSATSIANDGILRANGAELDINGEAIANTGTLAAINHGILKLIGMTVTDTGSGHVSVEFRADTRSPGRDHRWRYGDEFRRYASYRPARARSTTPTSPTPARSR